MVKKINEKTAGISLAGFQPRSKDVMSSAPGASVANLALSPAPVTPKPYTGAGVFMSAMSGKDGLSKDLADARARLEQFEGAKIVRLLDPTFVHPSKWANRSEQSFHTPEFEALKLEIDSTGGNVQPIIVRPRSLALGGYEIGFGHRRHRACLELGLPVLALIEELTDVELFTQMDRENRQRADLRPYEQGLMYARALDEGLFSSMRKMCEQLGVDAGNASKAIALARLPADVLASFSSPLELQQAWATPLSAALQKNPDVVLSRAKELSKLESKSSATAVFNQLIGEGVVLNNTPSAVPLVVQGEGGKTGKISFNAKKKAFEIQLNGLDARQLKIVEAAVKKLLS